MPARVDVSDGPVRPARVARLADALTLADRAVRWWTGELAALLPASLRERLASTSSRLVVVLGATETSFLLENGGEPRRLGSVALDSGADPSAALAAFIRRYGFGAALARGTLCIGIRLPAEKAVRTTVTLPLAAESNLDQVISFELDRHTPFTADRAYVSARVVSRDAVARRMDVELTVVPHAVADETLRLAERLGLAVDRLDAATDVGGTSGNLLPARAAAGGRKGGRVTYAWAALAAVLGIVAVYLPLARLQHEAAAADRQFAAIRATAALEREVDEARRQRLFIINRKSATVPVSTLLLEITHLLPDDTSLTALQVAGDEIQLGGTTSSAATLIALLEQSHKFKDTRFRTPVMPDPATGRETFYIAARIVPAASP